MPLAGFGIFGHTVVGREISVDGSSPSLFSQIKGMFGQNVVKHLLIEARPFDRDLDAEVEMNYSDSVVYLEDPYHNRLKGSITFTQDVQVDAISPNARTAKGSIKILVSHDDYTDPNMPTDFHKYLFGCRSLVVKLGGQVNGVEMPLSEYGTILGGKIRDVEWSETPEGDVLEFNFQDARLALRTPALATKYAGTGGIEGGEDLKEKRKPKNYGRIENYRPVFLGQNETATGNIYHLNDGEIQQINKVKDGGYEILPSQEVGDVFFYEFTEQEVDDREYVYELDRSLIMLPYDPPGDITVDFYGDADASLGGYVETAPEIAYRIAIQAGVSPNDLTQTAFLGLANRNSAPVSYSLDIGSAIEVDRAISEVLADLWAFPIGNREGKVSCARVELGYYGAQVSIKKEEVYALRKGTDTVSAKDLVVFFRKNWFVQKAGDLAKNADPDDLGFAVEEYRKVIASTDASVTDDFLDAKSFEIKTKFAIDTDALTEQARRFFLLKEQRHFYTAIVGKHSFSINVGQNVNLQYGKWGLENGKDFFVFSVKDDTLTGTTTLGLWG